MADQNGTSPLLAALLAFQKNAPKLTRDGTNPHFNSKFVTLDQIVKVVTPALHEHGLLWTALPTFDEQGHPALKYMLAHAESGDTLEGVMPLMLSKQDAQGQGSALTYARRYALAAVLNLVADEDDDGGAASQGGGRSSRASNGSKVSKADITELQGAAKGLTTEQIKLAFTATGIPVPDPFVWNAVPKAKAGQLAQFLAAVERSK